MDFQRLILFGALGMVLLLLWQAWLEHESGQQSAIATSSQSAQSVSPGLAQSGAATSATATDDVPRAPTTRQSPEPGDTTAVPVNQTLPSAQRIVVETDIVRAEIDTNGGDLRYLELLTYPVAVDRPDEPFVLLNDSGADLFLIQDGLLGSGHEFPNHHTPFSARATDVRLAPGENSVSVDLDWTSTEGVSYRKTFTFHRNSYYIDVTFSVYNQSASEWKGYQYQQILRTQVVEKSSGLGFFGRLPSYKGGAIFTPEDKYEKIDFEDMSEANLARATPSGWVAMLQHYFVGALLPQEDDAGYEFYSNVTQRDSAPRYLIGYKTTHPASVPVLAVVLDHDVHTACGEQLGGIDHSADPAGQTGVLPVIGRQLQINGAHEKDATAHENTERAFRRRQAEIPAGHDGDLQEGKDQSPGRLPADRNTDPGLHRAVLGVAGKRGAAPGTFHLVDQGSIVAGSLLCAAGINGCLDVRATVAEPSANGSHAAENHDGLAIGIHSFLSLVPFRVGALLVGQQRVVHLAAMGDYPKDSGS